MKSSLPLYCVALALFLAPSSALFAQKTTVRKLFDKQVAITLPNGAYINGYDDAPGQDGGWSVSLVKDPYSSPEPVPTISIMAMDLSPKQLKMSDAQWRKDVLSYYSDPKNKQKYKFKNYDSGGKGKELWVTVQSTFKYDGKSYTYRSYEKHVRISKSEVVSAFFSTDKPASWNTSASKRLRGVAASLRALKK
jgi:hypothetical protein